MSRFIRYTYEDESLKRIESNFVDKTEDTKEREQVLLKGVKNELLPSSSYY